MGGNPGRGPDPRTTIAVTLPEVEAEITRLRCIVQHPSTRPDTRATVMARIDQKLDLWAILDRNIKLYGSV